MIYHLVEEDRWREAGGEGYLPPTYDADGFIHACHLAPHLLPVANNFYKGKVWLCCVMMRMLLLLLLVQQCGTQL